MTIFGKMIASGALLLAVAMPCAAQQGKMRLAATVDAIVAQALADKEMPGAVVEVGHAGHVILRKAYGERALEPQREPMSVRTVFDMASLTKPLITATAVMQLFEQGKLRLNDPVARFVPEFAEAGKQEITLRQLLTHYSGLPPDLDLSEGWAGKQEAFAKANASVPVTPPGAVFRYSDINFIVLQEVVEHITGIPLDEYARKHILGPLAMVHSGFKPRGERGQIAPTEYDEHSVMLRGVVHDPTARRMGGVAGHAGLFSTADDTSRFAQALLDRLAGRRSNFPLRRATVEKMTTPQQPATGTQLRGLGWDIESVYSGNRGELFPVGSFGHTGFTGTSLWIDPASDTYVVILANAVHPHSGHNLTPLRGRIATAVAAFLDVPAHQRTGYNESMAGTRTIVSRNGVVLTGIDVLEREHFSTLGALAAKRRGKLRIGVLTNQTGLDAGGRRTIDVLVKDAEQAVPGLRVTTLFSPEHGIAGVLDSEKIANDFDRATSLPIESLYGSTDEARRPRPEKMRELDAVVIDLQDAGVRFYTYETLVGYFLESASQSGTEIVLLDRPNPINGVAVQGPISTQERESYTNYMPLPVRHGMTLGELATYFKQEKQLSAPLTVVKMQGWQRGDWFDSTGLVWTNPSPNLRSLNEATLYPGIGLLETANLSVGRGTDTPFEWIGAPWIKRNDAKVLASTLNARLIAGVRFVPVYFTPRDKYPFSGEECGGVQMIVTDRDVLDSPELGMEIASALWKLHPNEFHIDALDHLVVDVTTLKMLKAGSDPRRIADGWQDGLTQFTKRRAKSLLY